MISDSIRFQCIAIDWDPHSRYIFIKGKLDGQLCTISSIYAPNTSQLEFLKGTQLKLLSFQEGHLMVWGNLNCIAHKTQDRAPGKPSKLSKHKMKGSRTPGVGGLSDLLNKFQLTDTWRHCNPSDRDYTFFSPKSASFS